MAISAVSMAQAALITRSALQGSSGEHGMWTHTDNSNEILVFVKAIGEALDKLPGSDATKREATQVIRGALLSEGAAIRWTHATDLRRIVRLIKEVGKEINTLKQ